MAASELFLRKIPFDFAGVDFLWNPESPSFSMLMNAVTFQAIGFEIYMCRAMRDAEKLITDPAILAEARAFSAQESIHSLAHKKHVKALVTRYPGLQEVLDESLAGFDEIYRTEDLNFHLAFAANIEATFTPLFGTIIEYRNVLFKGGDPRISALMLWHFCEEIEHRSSALALYNHVVRSKWYRTKQFRKVLKLMGANVGKIHEGFRKHMPEAPPTGGKGALAPIPLPARLRMIGGIIESQMPWHNPAKGRIPAFYGAWRQRYERGEDMTALPEFAAAPAIA